MSTEAAWEDSQAGMGDIGPNTETAEIERQLWQQRLYFEALSSHHYPAARRRIFRQLVESLLYEKVIQATSTEQADGNTLWTLEGRGLNGEQVHYFCKGKRHLTFGRLRLTDEPIMRVTKQGSCQEQKEADSIPLFLLEVVRGTGADEAKLLHFIRELEQTLINDTLARHVRSLRQADPVPVHDEEWEQRVIEGHPYHPSYKSRIGFRVEDQLKYGPEFGNAIRPLWLAVRKERVRVSRSAQARVFGSANNGEWIREQIGEETLSRFDRFLRENGAHAADAYTLIPVHPWQWESVITSVLAEDLRNGYIVPLGISDHAYTAQQSIRTLANRSRPDLASLKLSLSIINTSTGRVIAPHTVQNAPLITDWLQGIASEDPYLRDELRVIMLGEIVGAAYDNSHVPDMLQPDGYGVLSCIWRESVYAQLGTGESVLPFNALATLDAEGCPVIEPWIGRYGAEAWLNDLLNVSVLPLIHWLFAHGIALESHAQNMLLIHDDGKPLRIALKDFHDGIRFKTDLLAEPGRCPELVDVPEYHRRVNRNSFLVAEEAEAVRDFVHDAFFFINLGELALFMQEHYGIPERHFWNRIRRIIEQYQHRFPEHQARYEAFSLFEPEIGVEQLTKRRMYPDDELRMHQVPNPLSEPSNVLS
ncbi:IucA/IucC family protein [Paenibacillus hubeiensis]|uniref:IucA/IucC family protein n=1 Tax=Paenibacillus hubeiensis TaxID=3077330 RepID=UPI0031BA3BD6